MLVSHQRPARTAGPAAPCHRQVEVHCGEQGRALAHLWNTYITSLEATVGALRRSNQRLASELAGARTFSSSLAQEVKTLDFLRREVRYWVGPAAGACTRVVICLHTDM